MTNDLTMRCNVAGIPVVMFNRGQEGADISSVTSANKLGGKTVAEYLLSCGHRNIAHISGWSGSSTGRDRQAGFCAALAAAGMTPQVIDGMFDRETAAAATRTMMTGATPPDAIFVGNDHMAFAVLDTLRHELGLRVPEDVAVIGYDDVPLAAWPAYNLTTMRQPVNRMVEATVNTLLSRIDDPSTPARRIEIESPLIARGTTKGPIT
jgi:DNA-binding LacI/PurR family transcriptional regulator